MDVIEIFCSFRSLDEARRIVHDLLAQSLAFEAEISPWMERFHLLEGKPIVVQESKVVMKAALEKWNEIQGYITLHSTQPVSSITYRKLDLCQ